MVARGFCVRWFFATKLRRAVTPAIDRLRLGCVKKCGSLPRFVPNRVFRIFSLATFALRPLMPSVCLVSKKSPGREKPQGFKQKGEKQKQFSNI